jgi:hypothetical protein
MGPNVVAKMIKGRAVSAADKKKIIERLFAAWLEVPSLRFGQFMINALGVDWQKLFNVEDDALATQAEELVAKLKANRK